MQWLSVWLQETNFPYPGPRCQDGRLLRQTRLDRKLCTAYTDSNLRANSADDSGYTDADGSNYLPLLNEHGDLFQRELLDEFNEECDDVGAERPTPNESGYYYDHYDYQAGVNDSAVSSDNLEPSASSTPPASLKKPPHLSGNIDLNNTILNTNFLNKRPSMSPQQMQSPFTFFGYPIPSLSLGRFLNQNPRARKDRLEPRSNGDIYSLAPGKTRMYQPSLTDYEKYLQRTELPVKPANATGRNRYAPENPANIEERIMNSQERAGFRTTFREPALVERGGFRPILPGEGGFTPMKNSKIEQTSLESTTLRNFVPLPTLASASKQTQIGTYYVTETTVEVTTAPATTSSYDNDDLEAQSVSLLRPPPLLQSTTAETILLIPPAEEHMEQFKRHSFLGSTTTTTTETNDAAEQSTNAPASTQIPRSRPGGRSTITKVYTPQTLNQYLPTAEEFFRTTTLPTKTVESAEKQRPATAYFQQDIERKDGMDWYYDSFKKVSKPRKHINATRPASQRNQSTHTYKFKQHLLIYTFCLLLLL